ncbi:50S ribosomal protein L25/general stress protein Ctc [Salinisphaera sp. USBA-960]|uniref:50S ribosomal protein L25/general stress protein Ctc n=1 Tax=Salinisphaera orenii TaxID=856731 RepID=UPI000DBE8515|nr:50S ribosomal protein L25/general stress protein Ctc [Salifodinibacter halophilus]NNC25465.1 50S ribosomal protein L25/general stress protein Ctc [Salifodinibacter halophilus]
MDEFELEAKPRTETGRGPNRRLRRSGWVPAIIYGGNGEPSKIALEQDDLCHHLENEAFFSHVIRIKIEGGKSEDAILRDLQRHPARPFVEHADFQRVVANQPLRMGVPLHFAGAEECPGVVEENGIVEHNLNEVEIECLPRHLPEYIEVDCHNLNVNDTVHLSELTMPANVTLVALMGETDEDEESSRDQSVVTVSLPRAEVETQTEEEAEGESADAEQQGDSEQDSDKE